MIIFIGLCSFIGYIILMVVMYGAMPDCERGGLNNQKYFKELDDARRERRPINIRKCYGK